MRAAGMERFGTKGSHLAIRDGHADAEKGREKDEKGKEGGRGGGGGRLLLFKLLSSSHSGRYRAKTLLRQTASLG